MRGLLVGRRELGYSIPRELESAPEQDSKSPPGRKDDAPLDRIVSQIAAQHGCSIPASLRGPNGWEGPDASRDTPLIRTTLTSKDTRKEHA